MNWICLRSLHEVYIEGKTLKKTTLLKDPYIKYLIRNTRELKEDSKYLTASNGFKLHYEEKWLPKFETYNKFLIENSLLKPQTRFEEADIIILMGMLADMKSGDLSALRTQIIESEESVRGVSLMFFKNDKYLEGKSALVDAVKKILDIREFANDKDQQYRYVLDCSNPKCIVLCENSDFLKRPALPRKNGIELWYAGGRNVNKLEFADTRGLPIYYSCDWDYDGLDIFSLVLERIPSIKILIPTALPKGIKETDHESQWLYRNSPEKLSGLKKEIFGEKEQAIIVDLIKQDKWIVEEANNLVQMLDSN
ncbi:MAG: hypothetical protein JST26_00190 [Bacteroidetes bacterium]|nr:hypothetical protein [Bacteroidota bacterium]